MNYTKIEKDLALKKSSLICQAFVTAFMGFLLFLYVVFGDGKINKRIIYLFIVLCFCFIVYLVRELNQNQLTLSKLCNQKRALNRQRDSNDRSGLRNSSIGDHFSNRTSQQVDNIIQRHPRTNLSFSDPFVKKDRRSQKLDRNSYPLPAERVPHGVHRETHSNRFSTDNRSYNRAEMNDNSFASRRDMNTDKKKSSYLYTQPRSSSRQTKPRTSLWSAISNNKLVRMFKPVKNNDWRERNLNPEELEKRQSRYFSRIESLDIDLQKYNTWVHQEIQNWLAYSFIPELIQRNRDNLEGIDKTLRSFGFVLKDYQIVKGILEGYQNDFQDLSVSLNDSVNVEQGLRLANLDEIISYSMSGRQQWGSCWENQFFDNSQVASMNKELKRLIRERNTLDSYFKIDGYSISNIRLFMLKKLCRLQNDGFIREINNENEKDYYIYPSNEEILLNIFISYISENNNHYQLMQGRRISIFITSFMEVAKKNKEDFFLQKNPNGNITIFYGETVLENFYDIQTAFSVMVLLTHHMKQYHTSYINTRQRAFNELISRFNIKSRG